MALTDESYPMAYLGSLLVSVIPEVPCKVVSDSRRKLKQKRMFPFVFVSDWRPRSLSPVNQTFKEHMIG